MTAIKTTLACALAVVALGACGGDEPAADPEVIVPEETAVPYEGYERADGMLESADPKRVVLVTNEGERMVFRVREINLPTIQLPHLQSHAGAPGITFRVYYEQQGRRRFIIGAEELPPSGG